MMNPFRKKTSSSSNNVNSGNNNNQQRRGLRGIVIGSTASPSAAAPSSNGLQASIPNPNQLENGMPSANHQAQNSLALPPESDYRTSLIMPHLTRRFTLLRAPDGTMVTPDAMRAHLRAQRARARARNTAVGAPELGFLTEQEENEIIEQLKAQSRDEDYEEGSVNSPWNSVSNNGEDWTNSGYGSGTDGFGSWGGTTSNVDYSKNGDGNGSNNGSSGLGQIHESISEGLNSQTSPTGRGEDGIGGLFSSRSASRDNAYIRSVDKQRSKGLDNPTEPIIQESQEEEDEEEEPMPGDFLAATKRSSQNPHPSSSPRSSPVPPQMTPSSSSGAGGLHPDRALNNSSPHSASSLLTTLSPEAFKRVSTALEEVFGMVSGEIPDDDDGYDEDQEEEIREDENREINPSYHLRRTSQDSDERSFASAASDLIQSTTTHTRQSGDDDEIQDVDDEEEEGDQSRDQDQQLHSEQMMTSDSIGTILGAPSSDDRAYQDDRTFQRNPQVGNQIPPQVMERPATPPNQETTRLYAHSSSSPPSSGRSQTASSFGGKVNNSHSPNGGGVGMDALASSSSSGFSGNQRSPNLSHSRSGNSLTDSSYLHQQQQQSNQAMHPRARSPSINSVTSGYSYSGQGQGGSSHHRQRSNQVSLDPANGRFKLGPSSPNSSTFNNQSLRKTPSLGSVSDVNNQVYGSSPNNGQLSRENSTSSNRDTGSGSFQYDSASNGYASRIRQNSGEAISKEPIVNEVEEEEEGIPDGFGGVIKPLGRNGTQRQQQQQQQQQQPSTKPVMKIPLDGVPQGDWRRPSLPTDGSSSPAISGMSSPVSVISANAIAARSQNYFPPSSAQSMGAYATGFKPSVRGAGANANGSRPESSSTAESHRSPIAGQAGSSTETAGTSYVGHTQDSISNLNNSAYSNNNSGSGGGGLMPRPPADPEQAERWRQTYGAKTADAASIRSSSDVSGVSDDEEDGEGDVWAKVRDSKSNSKGSKSSRPISHLPPRAAESQLASSGMTMDKLAEMQSNLVRSASQKGVTSKPRNQSTEQEAMPSPPTTTTTTTVDSLQRSTSVSSPPSSPPDRSRSPAQAAASSPAIAERLEKARARAKQIAQDQAARAAATAAAASGSNPSSASSPLVASPIGHGSSPSQGLNQKSSTSSSRYAARSVDERDQPSPPAPTTTAEAPSSHPQKSAVMYDVTSSHRPTSPPPPPRAMSPPNALPSLRDLGGFQPLPSVHRESVSLSQALEQAGHTPSQSINSLEDSRGEIRTEYDRSQGSLPFPNSGLSSAVYEEDELAFNDSGPFGNDAPGLPRSQSHNALASAANNQATTSTPDQNRWSDPGRDEFQPKYMTPQLLDDVASQARAATRALKGVDNETFPLPPRRSKTLSKAKSSRKLAKAISTPQLISTTQRLDHTTNLNTVYGAKAAAASRRPVPDTRTRAAQAGWPQTPSSPATDYREDGKPKVAKQGTHRRRSSSFGHQGQLDALFAQEASNEAGLRSPSSGQGQMSSMTLPRQTPPGTASPGGRQPGSIGRLVSRLTQRGRKQSEGTPNIGGTIDPFPTNKSTPTLPSPYHNEHDSPALPFHSAQATPDRNFGSEGAQKLVGLFDTQGGASPVAPRREGSLRKGKSNLQSERVPAVPGLGSPASIQGGWSSVSAQQQPSQAAAFDQGKLSSEVVDQNNESFNQTSESSFLADDEAGISNRDSINAAELFLKNSGDEAEESSKVQNRKSARDTIVRRTLIFPNPELIEDRRKSSLSVASNSRRKSRRPPMEEPAPLPITKSNSFKGHDRTASTGSSAGRRSIHDRPATPPGPAGAGGGHRRKPSNEVPVDQPVPRIPSRLSKQGQSLGTNFEQGGNERLSTLVPPSPSSPANRRASQAQSSYAGSLYDMYIGDDEPDSQRQSRFPPNGTRNHIEVTERADGSVVWQVIAGLADQRASTYSDSYAPNHSRHASDASNFSGNDLDFARDSYASGEGNDPSPRGQTADLEDGRSLFAGRRGHNTSHKKQSSLDIAIPPLPTMPQVAREGGSGSDQFPGDESNSTTSPTKPAWDYGPASSSSTSRLPKGASSSSLSASTSRKSQVRSPQHLGFEMATSPNGDVGTNPTSPTRIVYTSDAELAQMLESLARGQDSAKFDVRWAGAGSSSPTPSLGRERTPSPHIQSTRDRPSSSFTGGSGMSMDVDQQRQRVEQEIYSLLQQENSSPNNVY